MLIVNKGFREHNGNLSLVQFFTLLRPALHNLFTGLRGHLWDTSISVDIISQH